MVLLLVHFICENCLISFMKTVSCQCQCTSAWVRWMKHSPAWSSQCCRSGCWHGSFTLSLSGDDYFDLAPRKASGFWLLPKMACQKAMVQKHRVCAGEVDIEVCSGLLGPSHTSEWWFLDPLRATGYRNRCKDGGLVAATVLQLIFPTAHCPFCGDVGVQVRRCCLHASVSQDHSCG